jgi:hypothetical protein
MIILALELKLHPEVPPRLLAEKHRKAIAQARISALGVSANLHLPLIFAADGDIRVEEGHDGSPL